MIDLNYLFLGGWTGRIVGAPVLTCGISPKDEVLLGLLQAFGVNCDVWQPSLKTKIISEKAQRFKRAKSVVEEPPNTQACNGKFEMSIEKIVSGIPANCTGHNLWDSWKLFWGGVFFVFP